MGYLHIENLYKNTDILLFKECYALEKIHGTSAHISWKNNQLKFYSGGINHQSFIELFNEDKIKDLCLKQFDNTQLIIYGEAYGGNCQKMQDTYGNKLKFVVFDIIIDECWLDVLNAEKIAIKFGLEFVDYVKIPCDIEHLNIERDKPSTQAIRNGCGNDKIREGIVIRPLIELRKNNNERIIAKYKGDSFSELRTKREINPNNLKIINNAIDISEEWVTPMRLNHVLDKLGNPIDITQLGNIIKVMIEDVYREGKGEFIDSYLVPKYIGRKTAQLYKKKLNELIR